MIQIMNDMGDNTPLFILKEINISEIDMEDRFFCFRYFNKASQDLIDSVKRFGIINPPLVRRNNNKYQILEGFKRIDAVYQSGIENINCTIVKQDLDKEYMILLLISLFLSSGTPHIVDQAVFLAKISAILPKERIVQEILPLLGYPSSAKILERLIPLSRVEAQLAEALMAGIITHEMSLRLLDLTSEEREEVVSLFLYFHYSQSKQFEILEHLIDSSRKEDRSLSDIVRELKSSEDSNKSHSKERVLEGELFRAKLRKKRFPVLTNLEAEWKKNIKGIHLSPSVSLMPPPYFEGGIYRLAISFKDLKGFTERLHELMQLKEKDEWKRLFFR